MGRLVDSPHRAAPPPPGAASDPSPPPETGADLIVLADPVEGTDGLRPILEEYARCLRVRFTLHVPPAHHRPPQPLPRVHVHCFAVPCRPVLLGVWPRTPLVRHPFAFGHVLPAGPARAFAPGGLFDRGRTLADADGRPMIQVRGANLYILMDLLAQGDLAPVLLRRCLDLGLPALPALDRATALPAEARTRALAALACATADVEAGWRARGRLEARRRFEAEVGHRLRHEGEGLRREMDRLEAALEEHARRITADTRALAQLRRRLQGLQGLPAEPADLLAEFDRIHALPEVRQVDARQGAVGIITHPLEAEYAGQRYRLGAFRVDIDFQGDVRIRNLTEPRGPYDHPHIRQGRPCLGNAREGVAKLIGELQLAAAAQVLLDFLQTVNPRDWRIPVFYWPRAEPRDAPGRPAQRP